MTKKHLLFCFVFPLLLSSCSDDYVYPNVLTEFIDLQTDGTGTARYLVTDGGTTWRIRERDGLDGLTPDSIYRTVSMYAPVTDSDSGENEAVLYSCTTIVSPIPVPEEKFSQIKTDAVTIQSIWRSGNYLNLVLLVMIKERTHSYHFIENKLESNDDGTRTLYLTLFHDRNDDPEGYSNTVYLSVPLWAYSDRMEKGDGIVFRLNTYEEGMTDRTFTY